MELSTTTVAADPQAAAQSEEEPIPAEVLAAIAASVTAFLGANFSIRSLEQLHPPHNATSRWTRMGRASVQASHNVRSKR